MAWLQVNIAMILGHQDLTLGEGSDPTIIPITLLTCLVTWLRQGRFPQEKVAKNLSLPFFIASD